jgi:hypothetical protein
MFIEFAAHASVAASFAAFEKREEISAVAGRLWDRLLNGTQLVVVLGAGGVGKTTLGKFIQDPTKKVLPLPYNESFGLEKVNIPGRASAQILAAPGQERRFEENWENIDKHLHKYKRVGLVNIVANGYHSTTLSMKDIRKDIETTNQTKSRFFHDCREKELALLRDIELKLKKLNKPLWMITLVTKQDLWWADKENVKNHYESGAYGEIIKRITNQHDASGFKHEFLSISFHSQNLSVADGEAIVETSKGYDDAIKYAHQYRFVELLTKFVGD